jgi:hypothetical protein
MSEHHNDHDLGDETSGDPSLKMELETQTQLFLELRQQNLELLQIAARVAGYMGEHGPLKNSDLKPALRAIWDIYAEFHAWVDPEDSDEDFEGEEE